MSEKIKSIKLIRQLKWPNFWPFNFFKPALWINCYFLILIYFYVILFVSLPRGKIHIVLYLLFTLTWPNFMLWGKKVNVLIQLWDNLVIINGFEGTVPKARSDLKMPLLHSVIWGGSKTVSHTDLLLDQLFHLPGQKSHPLTRFISLIYVIYSLSTIRMQVCYISCVEGPRITSALPILLHIIKFTHHLTKRPKVLFLFRRINFVRKTECEKRIAAYWICIWFSS